MSAASEKRIANAYTNIYEPSPFCWESITSKRFYIQNNAIEANIQSQIACGPFIILATVHRMPILIIFDFIIICLPRPGPFGNRNCRQAFFFHTSAIWEWCVFAKLTTSVYKYIHNSILSYIIESHISLTKLNTYIAGITAINNRKGLQFIIFTTH